MGLLKKLKKFLGSEHDHASAEGSYGHPDSDQGLQRGTNEQHGHAAGLKRAGDPIGSSGTRVAAPTAVHQHDHHHHLHHHHHTLAGEASHNSSAARNQPAGGAGPATENSGLPGTSKTRTAVEESSESLNNLAAQKNMVFVEAPVTMERESPADPVPLIQQAMMAAKHSHQPSTPKEANVFKRIMRVKSLPLLLDTHGLLPGVTAAPVAQLDEASEAVAADAAYAAKMQAEQIKPRKRRPRRESSLKHLLHLGSYDFVTDVDVRDAQDAINDLVLPRLDSGEKLAEAIQGQLQPEAEKESNLLAVSKALPRKMKRLMWSVRDYDLLKKLHQGYASDVFSARCRISGELVVLKVYRLAEQCDLQRVQLYREIRVHSRMQHNNIIQFYVAFLEENCVVIVQEFAGGGDLLRYMYKYGGRLIERQAVNLVLQPFLAALHYLHTQGIVHRDIKPENCLLTESRILKLADFGLAVDLNEERANTRAGTLDYMAPEVLRCPTKKTPDENKRTPNAAHYNTYADAWAVGVFAYELVVGAPPFKAEQMIDTARNIIAVNMQFPPTVSEMARDFITRCLRKHPGDRPTVIEMLHHPWITMFQRRSSVVAPPSKFDMEHNIVQSRLQALNVMGGLHSLKSSTPASPAAGAPAQMPSNAAAKNKSAGNFPALTGSPSVSTPSSEHPSVNKATGHNSHLPALVNQTSRN